MHELQIHHIEIRRFNYATLNCKIEYEYLPTNAWIDFVACFTLTGNAYKIKQDLDMSVSNTISTLKLTCRTC